jgi:hypothetical protein
MYAAYLDFDISGRLAEITAPTSFCTRPAVTGQS